ncbi:hypothetical protein SLA2020_171320 [Shorea laevis]
MTRGWAGTASGLQSLHGRHSWQVGGGGGGGHSGSSGGGGHSGSSGGGGGGVGGGGQSTTGGGGGGEFTVQGFSHEMHIWHATWSLDDVFTVDVSAKVEKERNARRRKEEISICMGFAIVGE